MVLEINTLKIIYVSKRSFIISIFFFLVMSIKFCFLHLSWLLSHINQIFFLIEMNFNDAFKIKFMNMYLWIPFQLIIVLIITN